MENLYFPVLNPFLKPQESRVEVARRAWLDEELLVRDRQLAQSQAKVQRSASSLNPSGNQSFIPPPQFSFGKPLNPLHFSPPGSPTYG